VAALALVAVASAPVLAAWFWVAGGVRGPVGGVSSPLLPAFVAASSAGGPEYRTLVLREDDGTLTYSVIRQGDPTLGEPELTGYAPADQALARQVAALGAANGADAGDPGLALGEFGIRWVLLPSPVDPVLAERLDASVGLISRSSAPAYDLWQVTGPVSRVRVIGPDGTVTPLAGNGASSVPASGGTVVLAEPNGGWTATVNGHSLVPAAKPYDGWAQAFTLPPGGGTLAITRANTARDISLIIEVIVFLAACVLAVPGKRTEAADAPAATVPETRRESPRALESAPEGADAERPPGRRAARESARNHGSRTGTTIGGTRRRPTGPRAGGSHAAGPQTAVLPAAGRPDAADAGPGAVGGGQAGVGVLAAQEEPSTPPGTAPPWETGGWPRSNGSGPLPASPGPTTGERPAIGSGTTSGTGASSGPGPATGPFGKSATGPFEKTGTSADEHWAGVLAERDSGAWPALSQDEPPHGTPVRDEPIGASPGWTSPASTGPRPSPDWLSSTPAGWSTGPRSDANTGWTSASGTGPSPGWPAGPGRGTGPDSSANAGWNVGWGPGTDADQTASQPTARKPWESMPATPPREPSAGPSPAGRKPAERHSHRAGRHGRPARRPWDRSGKDKDGEP
jgi:hypothetical protein